MNDLFGSEEEEDRSPVHSDHEYSRSSDKSRGRHNQDYSRRHSDSEEETSRSRSSKKHAISSGSDSDRDSRKVRKSRHSSSDEERYQKSHKSSSRRRSLSREDSDNEAARKKSLAEDLFGSSGEESEEPRKQTSKMDDIFGSDPESEEERGPKKSQVDLDGMFGSEPEDEEPSNKEKGKSKLEEMFGSEPEDDNGDYGSQSPRGAKKYREAEEAVERITFECQLQHIPHPVSEESKHYLARLPKFMNMELKAFDPDTYEEDQQEGTEEERAQKIKLQVENTIRWRYAKGANDEIIKESNAKFVKWSDGTLSLLLGEELFDINTKSMDHDNQYVIVHHPVEGLLETQIRYTDTMAFRPASVAGATQRKMVMAIAGKHRKVQKAKMFITTTDPEKHKQELEAQEAERLRAQRRLESQRRNKASRYSQGLTEADLEAESDEERSYSGGGRRSDYQDGDGFVVDDDEVDEEDSEEEREREARIMRAKKKADKYKRSSRDEEEDDLDDVLEVSENDDDDDEDDGITRRSTVRRNQMVSDEDD
ncbi:Leo1-domain-containing protein [Basidiobolus meristosporus CBS 931.73]|uniref:Leo1-domain-containing protein n=1 Tax=Basidiobolus meristosporus CBS 931.73 TaxID=1314790 RepID=A0A1Y1Z4I6_9FUNG|nr:Leo1-domain-containing protein [Basidiobolus meristosporus CBS 931.73]|eukprot:ORY04745.1 Leo1-domain-containing protein [Basidiobolus meristosporus CBS 931.73]